LVHWLNETMLMNTSADQPTRSNPSEWSLVHWHETALGEVSSVLRADVRHSENGRDGRLSSDLPFRREIPRRSAGLKQMSAAGVNSTICRNSLKRKTLLAKLPFLHLGRFPVTTIFNYFNHPNSLNLNHFPQNRTRR
jgi:hypothetical protein